MNKLFIKKFHGIKRIDALNVFSFVYYSFREDLKKHFLKYNQKFRDIRDFYHVYYQNNVFLKTR
jgi:hypothetical protein